MRLRVAMQEQNRRTIAAGNNTYRCAAGLDRLAPESRKEVRRAGGYGLSECGRVLHSHYPGNYTDNALKERTPANRISPGNPTGQHVWTEICHSNTSVGFAGDYAA